MFKAVLHSFGTRIARPIYGGIGSIVALHRIIPESQRSRWTVNRALEITPEDLDAMIRLLLRQGFEFAPMDAVLEHLRAPGRRRLAAFTLDDGYRDNVEHALPVFERHHVPFTVYATRAFSEHRDSVWWYSLADALEGDGEIRLRHRGREQTHLLTDTASRERAFTALAGQLRACGLEERDELIAAICQPLALDPLRATRDLILTAAELRALASHPLATLGAHTVHHLTSNLLDEPTLRAEYSNSKEWLEDVTGKPVHHLAYPFGGANAVGEREFQAAQACGFHSAVTTRFANLFAGHALASWALPRLEISGNYSARSFTERAVSGLLPALRNRGRRLVIE